MAITIDLPQVGESVVEGVIGKWLKQPGDRLEKYEPLVEVVTDKVTMEVPSPVNGVLSRILAEEGATVSMGAPIAEMEAAEGEDRPSPAQPSLPEQSTENVGTIGYLVKGVQPVGPTGGGVEDPTTEHGTTRVPTVDRARYSPAVRRLAEEHSIDLRQVTGTGVGGRITRNDVLAAVETPTTTQSTTPSRPQAVAEKSAEGSSTEQEAVPLTPIRRIIAQNMVKSATEIPQAWSMLEVDVTSLVSYREKIKGEFRQREGVDLTYLPFAIKAVVESLKEHPLLNSTWGSDKIIIKKSLHIGIAVAAPEGLVVPVIHDADTLSISGLARAARDLTAKARQGKLALEDVQGGTFTVNNTGSLGSVASQPLINYPQAGIVTTETIQKRPVVINDAIAIRSMMNICLSFDHRIVDGAESGGFLQAVKRRLEAVTPDTPLY